MKIPDEVLAVLDRCTTRDNVLLLPNEQLERPLYEAVNKILVAAGGKWSRGARGHVFEGSAADAIEPVILTGEVTNRKQEFGQFDTPPDVAQRAVALSRIKRGMKLLEPSAGHGALAMPASLAGAIVFGYELDPSRHCYLMGRPPFYPEGGCGHRDFLTVAPAREFDRVLMNPPFAKRADVVHVLHATQFLKPGGRLVAIMSAGVVFRSDTLTAGLRDYIKGRDGTIEPLPEDSFKASGTGVNAVLVAFDVP